MIIEQIRNATIRVRYGGKTFLVDPWFAPKDSFGCFAYLPPTVPFTVRDSQKRFISMPICDLPKSAEEILENVDSYIVTHIHPDHIDMAMDGTVGKPLDKKIPVLVQNAEDAAVFRNSGFECVEVLPEQGLSLDTIKITPVPAQHGTDMPCGPAMGVVMEGEDKTLYIAGDTVWFQGVENNLERYRPQVIVLNACAAELENFGRLIMDAQDVGKVAKYMPESQIILSHMDNVAHASLSRTSLEDQLKEMGVFRKMVIPEDGQAVEF